MRKKPDIQWSEEQLEARLLIVSTAHQAVGWEEASVFVMGQATDLFKRGDPGAEKLRELSKKLLSTADGLRVKQAELQNKYNKTYQD